MQMEVALGKATTRRLFQPEFLGFRGSIPGAGSLDQLCMGNNLTLLISAVLL